MNQHCPDHFKADVARMALRGAVPKWRMAEGMGMSKTPRLRSFDDPPRA